MDNNETLADETVFLVQCHFDSLLSEQIAALQAYSFMVIDGELEAIPPAPANAA